MKLGNSRCQCLACGEYFNSVSAFELHRRGKPENRRCIYPSDFGMIKNEAGFWITGVLPREKFKGLTERMLGLK